MAIATIAAAPTHRPTATLTVDATRPVARFVPNQAFGVAFDGGDAGESRPLLAPANRRALAAVGVARGAYRLRTELAIEAWHWSAFGRWSNPAHAQGYWTGDPDRDDPAPTTNGYRLPRRGDTLDEAANDGFSRLDDGDPATFWKSDPYLDATYTGLPGERAEWIKLDLGAATPVDTLEIAWVAPYARSYRVQRWVGETPYSGRWVDFPAGRIEDGRGGLAQLRLGPAPITTRYVRLLLTRSSHTAPPGAADPRDAMGYAIGEVRLGRTGAGGGFVDAIRHAPDHSGQTLAYVSSTDPWHRAQDLDPGVEQPSPLAIARAGLIGGGPMMLPVGLLYDTPENALAEIAYFRRRGLKVEQVELGEEPDGQRVAPEDYGALYLPLARAIHARFPGLATGGPSLINGVVDLWLDDDPVQSWTKRFIAHLGAAQGLDRLGFFSFEHYPFDDLCGRPETKLASEPQTLDAIFARLKSDGVPTTAPLVVSEYGLSAYTGRMEVEAPSAVFIADAVAGFLSRGGGAAYLYGFGPNRTAAGRTPCAGRGEMMLWEADAADRARWPMPSFHAYTLMTREWVRPGDGVHTLFAAKASSTALAAYPLRRPDGRWSILLVNRGAAPMEARLAFQGDVPPAAPVEVLSYGPDRYLWSAALDRPMRDLPPGRSALRDWTRPVVAPPFSVMVVKEADDRRARP